MIPPKFLAALILSVLTLSTGAQNPWKLEKEKDGIRVSSRQSPTSSFNDVRVELDVPGSLGQLAAILLDIGKYTDWAYATKKAVLIKSLGPASLIYYSEIDVPWPATDRFFYASFEIKEDPSHTVMTVVSSSIPNYGPVPKDLVRVPFSKGDWIVKIIAPNRIHIDYILQLDPGNSLPAWILNLFSTKGPLETFQNIKAKMTALNRH